MLWLHSFFLGLGVAYFVSAAYPIFLSAFDIRLLPIGFAAAAVLQFGLGYLSERMEHSMLHSKFLTYVPIFLAVSTLVFRLCLSTGATSSAPTAVAHAAAWASFGLLAWSFVVTSMAQDEFWSLSSGLFDVRQSKRLFSLIDSGGFLAKIIGYFSVPLLLPFLGVADLLILSAAGMSLSAFVVRQILRRYRHLVDHPGGRVHPGLTSEHAHHEEVERHEHPSKKNPETSLPAPVASAHHHEARKRGVIETLFRHRYLASLSLVAFLAFFAMTCIDYGFLREIEHKYGSEASIASFLALFLGVTKVISFVLKVGLVGRLFNRFGLAKTVVVLPITLVAVTVVGLIMTWNAGEQLLIWFFIANNLLVEMWSEAVHVPALAIALQPLHVHERQEGRYAVSDVMEPMALGGAAVLLYFLSSVGGMNLQDICLVLLGVIAAWIVAIGWLNKEYGNTVRRALKHRRFEGTEMVWDEVTRKVIEHKLTSTHLSEVEYAIKLIPQTEAGFFLEWFPKLLQHGSEDIRMLALKRTEDFDFATEGREQLLPYVEDVLENATTNPVILGQALHCFVALRHDLEPESLKIWLSDERPAVREGLITGLIRFQGIDGILLAGEKLQTMLHSPERTERQAAAEIVGRVGVKQFYHPLLTLLEDQDMDVRMAATRAAAQVGHPRLIRPLIDLYLTPLLSHAFLVTIENALRGFGNAVFPYLAERAEEGLFDSARLQRMMRLLGYWGTPRSVELLTALLTWPVTHRRVLGELRLAALRAIVQAGVEIPDKGLPKRLLEEELTRVRSLLALILLLEARAVSGANLPAPDAMGVDPNDAWSSSGRSATLLRGAVSCEIVNSAQRVLLLLAVIHDVQTITRVRDSIFAGNDLHRSNAFETLDSMLPNTQSKPIISLLEASLLLSGRKGDASNLKELLEWNADDSKISLQEVLEDISADDERFYDPWTVATALYYAGIHSSEQFAVTGWAPAVAWVPAVTLQAAERTDLAGHVAQMLESYSAHGKPAWGSPVQPAEPKVSTTFFTIQSDGKPMPILFERVILLKTVDLFHETPDPVLAHIAQAMEEEHVPRGTVIMRKGDLGTCLYIIEEGSVSVHDGDHVLATLKSRQVVGELALLDPEPRSASVTALEDTTLLKLDWEVFYDLMVDNIEIARGAITTLCRRIRTQNEKLARLAAPVERKELVA